LFALPFPGRGGAGEAREGKEERDREGKINTITLCQFKDTCFADYKSKTTSSKKAASPPSEATSPTNRVNPF